MGAAWLKAPDITPWPWGVRHLLTEADMRKPVLPRIGSMYIEGKDSPLKRLRRAVAACHTPQDDEIYGDPVERYLEAMGAPKDCCTAQEPCAKHFRALGGRDPKSGKYRATVKYRWEGKP